MARWLVIAVLACGCRQLWGLGTPPHIGDDAPDDAPDAATDMTTGICYGTFGNAPYCSDAPAPSSVDTSTAIDTDSDPRCLAGHTDCVIIAVDIEIDRHLTTTGARPLVLIATQTISIQPSGVIDVGSHSGSTGAGYTGDVASCVPGSGPAVTGAGAGGSFGATGGSGGNGTVGSGGSAGPIANVPTKLRGGCPGQKGANGGAGAAGGGAVYLISAGTLRIDGDIDASGTGGGGAPSQVHGGGGGGSGGMIVLEAPSIEVHGRVYASGGGGGGGSSDLDGNDGSDPIDLKPAIGGTSADGAGAGGDGSGFAMPGGGPGSSSVLEGGGGGGGGAGVIKTFGGVVDLNRFAPEPS